MHTVCAMVLDDSVRNHVDPLGDRDPLRPSPRDMADPSLGLGVRLVGGQGRRRLRDNVCGRLLLLLLLLLLCCSEAPLCTDMLVSSSRDPAWLNRIRRHRLRGALVSSRDRWIRTDKREGQRMERWGIRETYSAGGSSSTVDNGAKIAAFCLGDACLLPSSCSDSTVLSPCGGGGGGGPFSFLEARESSLPLPGPLTACGATAPFSLGLGTVILWPHWLPRYQLSCISFLLPFLSSPPPPSPLPKNTALPPFGNNGWSNPEILNFGTEGWRERAGQTEEGPKERILPSIPS